jgi:hypothetical protein
MILFNGPRKNAKLIEALRASRVGFEFDQSGVKTRLLSGIEEQQMSLAAQRIREFTRRSFIRRHKYSAAVVALLFLVAGSSATIAEVDFTNPGGRLHSIDQFQEGLILKLPLPQTYKAEMRANFVDERTRELGHFIQKDEIVDEVSAAEVVKHTQTNLKQAVEQIRSMQESLSSQGKSEQAEQISEILTRLESLAEEQEKQVTQLKELVEDEGLKSELDEQIQEIQKARLRARIDLKH